MVRYYVVSIMTDLLVLVTLLTLYTAVLHVVLRSIPEVDESTGVHQVR
jgi:hypothetical protein